METIDFSKHWTIVNHEYPNFSQAERLSNYLLSLLVYQALDTKEWMLTVRDRQDSMAYSIRGGRDEAKAYAEQLLHESVQNSQILN